MEKSACLSSVTQGINGGNESNPKTYGMCKVFVGVGKSIKLDAFQGIGETYTRREDVEITIKDGNKIVFRGTFEDLVNKLSDKG